jgi:hypothetical protein
MVVRYAPNAFSTASRSRSGGLRLDIVLEGGYVRAIWCSKAIDEDWMRMSGRIVI